MLSSALNYPRTVKSYVRRAGRLTNGQEKALIELSEKYGLLVKNGLINFTELFNRCAPTIVEIGFGDGQSLLKMAMTQPQSNFIGIEVHPPGIGMLLKGIDEHQVTNLRIFQADAMDVLIDCIPKYSLSKVQIFFPDPWPKKRHHKRRLIQTDFIKLLHTRLKPGGLLHMATDWENYADHMVTVLSQDLNWRQVEIEKMLFAQKSEILRPQTKFESRGLKLGHKVWDFMYQTR